MQWHYRPACNNSFVSVTQPYIIFLDAAGARTHDPPEPPAAGLELTTIVNGRVISFGDLAKPDKIAHSEAECFKTLNLFQTHVSFR